jgi:hypothetical protein
MRLDAAASCRKNRPLIVNFGGMMRRLLSLLLILTAVFIGMKPASAQQEKFTEIEKRFQELYAAKNYAAALAEAKKIEAIVKDRLGVDHRLYELSGCRACCTGNV